MRERQPVDTGGKRPDYLTHSSRESSRQERAANDGGGLVLVRLDELLEAIRDAVTEAQGGTKSPRLLDKSGLAERLGCSVSTVDKMRRAGLPCLYAGESPRFLFDSVIAWMNEQRAPELNCHGIPAGENDPGLPEGTP